MMSKTMKSIAVTGRIAMLVQQPKTARTNTASYRVWNKCRYIQKTFGKICPGCYLCRPKI